MLDAALWSALAGTPPLGRFAAAWLALQCRMIDRAIRGVLVLRGEDGAITPIARWPEQDQGSPDLVQATELAMTERRGVASRSRAIGEERTTLFAFPLTAPGAPEGVIAVECAPLPDHALRDIMRQLQWGAGWMELHARRTLDAASLSRQRASLAALEITASALESVRLRDAARAVATELAVRLGAGRVAVGRMHRRHIRVLATSHVIAVGKRSTNTAELAAAMEEALDHQASVAYPPPEDAPLTALRAHRILAGRGDGSVLLTVPLLRPGADAADAFGALTLEWAAGHALQQDAIDLTEAVAALVGPALHRMAQAERWAGTVALDAAARTGRQVLGREHYGLKLVVMACAVLVIFFAVFRTDYRVTAHAVVEGELRRSIASGLDGYVATEQVRAGQTVHKGDVLATLDNAELVLQRLRWIATSSQHKLELDKALAAGQRAEVAIAAAQVDEAAAEIALLDEQIGRTRITRPLRRFGDQRGSQPIRRHARAAGPGAVRTRPARQLPRGGARAGQRHRAHPGGCVRLAGACSIAGRRVSAPCHPHQPGQRASGWRQCLPGGGQARRDDRPAAPEYGGRGAARRRSRAADLDLVAPSAGVGAARPLVLVALMAERTRSQLWFRVAAVCPRLSPHVRISRQHFRGQRWFVLEDTVQNRVHRFSPAAQHAIALMNGEHSVGAIWEALGRLGDERPYPGRADPSAHAARWALTCS